MLRFPSRGRLSPKIGRKHTLNTHNTEHLCTPALTHTRSHTNADGVPNLPNLPTNAGSHHPSRLNRLSSGHGGGGSGGLAGIGSGGAGGGGGGGGGEQQRTVFGPGLSVEKLKEMTKLRLQQQQGQGQGQGRSSPSFTGRPLSSSALGGSLGSMGSNGGIGGGSTGHRNERTEWRRSGSAGSAAMMEEHHRFMSEEEAGSLRWVCVAFVFARSSLQYAAFVEHDSLAGGSILG